MKRYLNSQPLAAKREIFWSYLKDERNLYYFFCSSLSFYFWVGLWLLIIYSWGQLLFLWRNYSQLIKKRRKREKWYLEKFYNYENIYITCATLNDDPVISIHSSPEGARLNYVRIFYFKQVDEVLKTCSALIALGAELDDVLQWGIIHIIYLSLTLASTCLISPFQSCPHYLHSHQTSCVPFGQKSFGCKYPF